MTTTNRQADSLRELLTDPNRLTLSLTEAADILGISRSTAFYAANTTGILTPGVPVIRIATGSDRERKVVSTAHLRAVLGIESGEA